MEKRNRYTAEFKAKVVMELLKEEETLSQIAGQYQLKPTNAQNIDAPLNVISKCP